MKNKYKYLKTVLCILTLMLTAFNCSKDQGENKNEIQFAVIGQGNLNDSQSVLEQYSVIKNKSDWESLIIKMNAYNNTSSTFIEKDIDFSRFIIIAVIDQVKGSGGWTIDITDIAENSENITVSLKNLHKGNATSVMTQPFQIVKIPIANKEIIFDKNLTR
jgi:hypothetical protein